MDYSVIYLVNLGHMMTISGGKRPDLGLLGASKWTDLLNNCPLGAPKLQKWTSDDYPVNICQLDYYVVFGAQSGLLQDLERGK